MSPSNLATLCAEKAELEKILAERGGDLGAPGSDLEQRWEANLAALLHKADAYALVTIELEGQAGALEGAARALGARAAALRAAKARMLDWASKSMGDAPALSGEVWALKRYKNPPSVQILDETGVLQTCPEAKVLEPIEEQIEFEGGRLCRVRIDKKALKAALAREGNGVQGAVLTQGSRIEIVPR